MSAKVRDIQALREFRAKLIRFAEEVEGALLSMQADTQKAFEWIEHECPQYWTVQLRKAFDQVASTRTALTTCQMRTVAGRKSSCIEEKIDYDRAKRRLQHCQEQQDKIKRWAVKIHHDVDEFRGRLVGLRRLIDVEVPQAMAMLEQSATILEQYADISRPASGANE